MAYKSVIIDGVQYVRLTDQPASKDDVETIRLWALERALPALQEYADKYEHYDKPGGFVGPATQAIARCPSILRPWSTRP